MHRDKYEIAQKALSKDQWGKPYYTLRQLAEEYKCSPSTVSKYRDQFAENERIEDHRAYNGKQASLSEREQRAIVREFRKNPMLSLRAAKTEILPKISHETIRNCLDKHEINAYKPAIRPPLDSHTRRLRVTFARRYHDQPVDYWQNVLFLDESYVHCQTSSHKSFVWRTKGSRLDQRNVKVQTTGGQSFMVWSYFSGDGTGDILRIEKDIDAKDYVKILQKNLPRDGDFKLLQDRAPVHTAEFTLDYLDLNGIEYFDDFPPYSPDLNPLENVWARMKRYLSQHPSRNKNDLWTKVLTFWDSVEMDYITELINSMPHRLDAVIKSKGGYTKY